jgi:hypothetical protein
MARRIRAVSKAFKEERSVTFRTKTILGTCAAMLLGFGTLAAQEKKAEPAPMPAPKATPAAPTFHYDPACCDKGCGFGHDGCCGIYAEAEALFLRYHRADGIRFGASADDQAEDFDFEITPRLTIGYECDGLGVRVRWWTFDYDVNGVTEPDSSLSVDTDVTDVEVFGVIDLGCNWTLEVSGGIRFVNFDETMFDFDDAIRQNSFDGWGGVIGAELRRSIGESCGVFARVRGAILMDDKDITLVDFDQEFIDSRTLVDSTLPMLELTLGVEYRCCLGNCEVFARATAEWQHWYNFSTHFEDALNNDDLGGPSDVGFGGFGLSIGVRR